jgi:hypothetical protein
MRSPSKRAAVHEMKVPTWTATLKELVRLISHVSGLWLHYISNSGKLSQKCAHCDIWSRCHSLCLHSNWCHSCCGGYLLFRSFFFGHILKLSFVADLVSVHICFWLSSLDGPLLIRVLSSCVQSCPIHEFQYWYEDICRFSQLQSLYRFDGKLGKRIPLY